MSSQEERETGIGEGSPDLRAVLPGEGVVTEEAIEIAFIDNCLPLTSREPTLTRQEKTTLSEDDPT